MKISKSAWILLLKILSAIIALILSYLGGAFQIVDKILFG